MNEIFIKNEYMKILNDIFDNYCPKAQIYAYGSRVKNEAHDGSDLDLVIMSFGDTNLSIGELRLIINDSNIPFLVDINEFNSFPESFQNEILKNCIKIYGQ